MVAVLGMASRTWSGIGASGSGGITSDGQPEVLEAMG